MPLCHYRLKEKILEFAKIQTFTFTLTPPHSLHRDEESDTDCILNSKCPFSSDLLFCDTFTIPGGGGSLTTVSLLFLVSLVLFNSN